MDSACSRANRVVEPHIATGNQRPTNLHVIFLEEDDLAAEGWMTGHLKDFLRVCLTAEVTRMGLARKDKLHRAIHITNDRREPLHIGEHERRTLVCREAAGETDGEGRRIEDVCVFIER